MTAKDWSPISVPAQDDSPPLIRSQAEGTIVGITPLKDSYVSLRPESQGLVGIGRLGFICSDESDLQFANCGMQHMHAVEHLMAISPGLIFCWVCQTWTLLQDDPNHSQECRSAHFATKPDTITLDDFIVRIRPPASLRSSSIPFYLPMDEDTTKAYKEVQSWVIRFFTAIAKYIRLKEKGKNAVKKRLIHTEEYRCILPKCNPVVAA